MAQICKFYGVGQCRFGQSCRFIHPGETTVASSTGSTGFGNNTFGNARHASFSDGVAQAKLGDSFNLPTEDSIRIDLTERPTWFLSSYAPGKDPPAQLIDGKDISPEEARVMAYKLKVEGNSGAYEVEWNQLTAQADTQIRNILSDLPGAVNFMKNAYENRTNSRYNPNNILPLGFRGAASHLSPFGKPEQPAPVFAQTPIPGQQLQTISAFNQQPQPTATFGTISPFTARPAPTFGQSAFGQSPPTSAFDKQAFGSALPAQTQGAFGLSAFGQPSLSKSTFGQPAFGQPAFGQPQTSGQTGSPFGIRNSTPTSAFGQPTSQQPTSAFGQSSPFGTQNVPKSAFGQPAFGPSSFAQSSPFVTNASVAYAQPHVPSTLAQPQQHHSATNALFGTSAIQNTAITPNVFQQAVSQNASQNITSSFSNSNPFQQGQSAASNQFQQVSKAQSSPPVSTFTQPTSPISTFGISQQTSAFSNQNPFQSAQPQQQPISHHVNSLLREQQKIKKWDDPTINYIKAERDAFASSIFTLGNVPTVAPSREMCWG